MFQLNVQIDNADKTGMEAHWEHIEKKFHSMLRLIIWVSIFSMFVCGVSKKISCK